jgi:hypothetical protein
MNAIEVWDGSKYLRMPGTPGPQSFAHVGPTPPESPEVGQMWVPDEPLLEQWDDDWQYPVLLNGWTEYNPAAYGSTRYRKMAGGLVIVDGMIKGGTVGDATKPVFVLPEGYRPSGTLSRVGCSVNDTICRILISATSPGYVSVHRGDPYWISLHTVFAI